MKIAQPGEASKLKALIFGPYGHGKTRLLATLDDDERTAPCLFLDFEGGVQSLFGRDIDVATIRDWTDYNEAYAVLSDPGTKYRSVAVDSISETQVGGLLAILEKDARRPDPDQLGQADYGIILVQMRRFVRSFRNLPMHVAMSALAGDDLDPKEGKVKAPLLVGSFANEAPGIFDLVAYLALATDEEGATERVLLMNSQPKFRVKSRSPMDLEVPAEIVDPTMGKVLDAMGYTTKEKRAR